MNSNEVRRRPSANPNTPFARVLRCSFTGYRPQKMPFGFNEKDPLCEDFKKRLKETIEMLILQGYSHFLSGGALGMDMFAAECVIALRRHYPFIALEMVIPFDKQADKWEETFQQRYNLLMKEADIITYTGHSYTRGCMFVRNRYLVNNADLLLAAFDGQTGGTAMTVKYAKDNGVQLIEITPVVRKGCDSYSA